MPDPSRLIVALDKIGPAQHPITNLEDLTALIQTLHPLGVGFKVRPSLLYRFGIPKLRAIGLHGPNLFVDAKLHDIGASCLDDLSIFIEELNPGLVTCHLGGSRNMLRTLAGRCQGTTTNLVGVTILTDIEPQECYSLYGRIPAYKSASLVHRAQECGITHIVCSPREVAALRAGSPQQTFITPGIRPLGSTHDDQSRVETPANAIAAGAHYLVAGRPITCVDNPFQATKNMLTEMDT